MRSFNYIVKDISDHLVGKTLEGISGHAAPFVIREVNPQKRNIIIELDEKQKSRPLDELERIWQAMAAGKAVHVESILSGSGSSRSQPETILANLPYVEWLSINRKKHIIYVEENSHDFGTTKEMTGEKAERLQNAIIGTPSQNSAFVQSDESYLESIRVGGGANILIYGVPGSGKSWTIQHEYCNDESRMERIVFHSDYTHSDFVGQILPDVSEGLVTYQFTPGPFTRILKNAYETPDKEFFLIIEEINRGNAPAIFGEVFQLLDRKTETAETNDDGYPIGTSEYGITNTRIASIVYKDPAHKVRIPSNLSIIGTMNTSDQNVFTLDTAFQRRWDMRMIESSFSNVDPALRDHPILDTTITWEGFCSGINTIILQKSARITSSEDKRLGPYFIHKRDLIFDPNEDDDAVPESVRRKARQNNRRFAEKVLKYLWDDAFKFSREDIFRMESCASLEQVITHFSTHRGNVRFSIFKEEIVTCFEDSQQN